MKKRLRISFLLILAICICVIFSACETGKNTDEPDPSSAPVTETPSTTSDISTATPGTTPDIPTSTPGTTSDIPTSTPGTTPEVPTPTPGTSTTDPAEPQYLGILASTSQPSQANGIPSQILSLRLLAGGESRNMGRGAYRPIRDVLAEYYNDPANYLGEALPVGSDYSAYSRAGETVYIQIWLNNPEQKTILSLMLNGTKYQVGGGLSSFFIEKDGKYYNCVYVAITVPEDKYDTVSYEVSKIEYISDTYINQDGTDEFMNENDTVTIGLEYMQDMPYETDYSEMSITAKVFSADITIADDDGMLSVCGGWLRIVVYDGENVIAQQKANVGKNTVSLNGLMENTDYWVSAILYADLHDGRGVSAHVISEHHFRTENALEVRTVDSSITYADGKHLPQIEIDAILKSPSASFVKLELYDEHTKELFRTYTDFNGKMNITDGIICARDYRVLIYYKDDEYPEGKVSEHYVWTSSLWEPYIGLDYNNYSIGNDAIINFEMGNGDDNFANIVGFTLVIYDEYSPRYIAEDVIYLLNNPSAIERLGEQINELNSQLNYDYEHDRPILDQIDLLEQERHRLEEAEWAWRNRHGEIRDMDYWQNELAKGKIYHTFIYYGANTANIIKIGKMNYYVRVENFFDFKDYGKMHYEITAHIDYCDGNGLQEKTEDGDVRCTNYLANFNGIGAKDIVIGEDGKLTYTLYNIDDYDNFGEYPQINKGYVWRIGVRKTYSYDEPTIIYTNTNPPALRDIDEDAWFAEYIECVKNGGNGSELYEKYLGKYMQETIQLDLSSFGPGAWSVAIYTRAYAKVYEDEEDWDNDISVYEWCEEAPFVKYTQYPTPEVRFERYNGAFVYFGEDNIPSARIEWDVLDADGNPYTEEYHDGYQYPIGEKYGFKIRARAVNPGPGYGDAIGWMTGEWSEWKTFMGFPLSEPNVYYDWGSEVVTWDWYLEEGAGYFVYKINDGTQVDVTDESKRFVELNSGDTIMVKVVALPDSGCTDSDWTLYTHIDTRQKLATPSGFRKYDDYTLGWNHVEGAREYNVKEVETGRVYRTSEPMINIRKQSMKYQVQAIPEDREYYAPSNWSQSFTA